MNSGVCLLSAKSVTKTSECSYLAPKLLSVREDHSSQDKVLPVTSYAAPIVNWIALASQLLTKIRVVKALSWSNSSPCNSLLLFPQLFSKTLATTTLLWSCFLANTFNEKLLFGFGSFCSKMTILWRVTAPATCLCVHAASADVVGAVFWTWQNLSQQFTSKVVNTLQHFSLSVVNPLQLHIFLSCQFTPDTLWNVTRARFSHPCCSDLPCFFGAGSTQHNFQYHCYDNDSLFYLSNDCEFALKSYHFHNPGA